MGDVNKAWSQKEKGDFQAGMAKAPNYLDNLKAGLGIGGDSQKTALERRRKALSAGTGESARAEDK